METIYIDVYFLINFTVDVLALYCASSFSKISTTVRRLIIAAFIGATYAVFGILFIERPEIMYILAVIILLLMVIVTSKGVGSYRRLKYTVAVVIFNVIIGGLVYYGYCFLDGFIGIDDFESSGGENKNLLILSLIVLLSIGALKLFLSAFANSKCEKMTEILVEYNGVETRFEAFVDSGNLAVDPFDKTPVMLINRGLSEKIFGIKELNNESVNRHGYDFKKKVRIIPVSFGGEKKILYGIRPDNIYAVAGGKTEKLSLIIATDEEGDSYGGYSALIPLSALEGVL